MFDVYVDGATGTSREAVRELAGAMAARYRLPAPELEARLTRGRSRVKAGVDRRDRRSRSRGRHSRHRRRVSSRRPRR